MTWYWWMAIAIYAAGAIGGVIYAGARYQRIVEEVREDRKLDNGMLHYGKSPESMAMDSAFIICVGSVFWPIASVLVVLYYGITAPFWLGKWIESRKSERRKALKEQYRGQADNLTRLAQDYERGTTERQILLDGAKHLSAKADTLK